MLWFRKTTKYELKTSARLFLCLRDHISHHNEFYIWMMFTDCGWYDRLGAQKIRSSSWRSRADAVDCGIYYFLKLYSILFDLIETASVWECKICKTVSYSPESASVHYECEHIPFKYICAIWSDKFRLKQSFEMLCEHEHKMNRPNSNRYQIGKVTSRFTIIFPEVLIVSYRLNIWQSDGSSSSNKSASEEYYPLCM